MWDKYLTWHTHIRWSVSLLVEQDTLHVATGEISVRENSLYPRWRRWQIARRSTAAGLNVCHFRYLLSRRYHELWNMHKERLSESIWLMKSHPFDRNPSRHIRDRANKILGRCLYVLTQLRALFYRKHIEFPVMCISPPITTQFINKQLKTRVLSMKSVFIH
jgi:hypothetical protein